MEICLSSLRVGGRCAVVALALLAVAACDSLPLPPLQPTQKPPSAPTIAREPVPEKEEICQKFEFSAALDVDTAYARAMRAFGFRTVEERKQAAKMQSYGYIDQGFKHAAQPGAFYRMSDYAQVQLPERRQSSWMNMEIWKDSGNRSGVKGDVCYSTQKGAPDQKVAIAKAINDVFQRP
jgi:hypothetical protein